MSYTFDDSVGGKTVHVMELGDTLLIKTGGNHTLHLLESKTDFEACNTTKANKLIEQNGEYQFSPEQAGLYYFACGLEGHCAGGANFRVLVTKREP